MSVPTWATDFVTNFYAKVADVESPSNYAAQFVKDGDLFMRAPFKGQDQIEKCMEGFWNNVKVSKHHGMKVFYNEKEANTIFVNGFVDLDNKDGNNLKDIEFASRFVLDDSKKIVSYRVWTCESPPSNIGAMRAALTSRIGCRS